MNSAIGLACSWPSHAAASAQASQRGDLYSTTRSLGGGATRSTASLLTTVTTCRAVHSGHLID